VLNLIHSYITYLSMPPIIFFHKGDFGQISFYQQYVSHTNHKVLLPKCFV